YGANISSTNTSTLPSCDASSESLSVYGHKFSMTSLQLNLTSSSSSKQGHPVIRQNDPTHNMAPPSEVDQINFLRRPLFSPSHSVANVNQELKNKGSLLASTNPTISVTDNADGFNPYEPTFQSSHLKFNRHSSHYSLSVLAGNQREYKTGETGRNVYSPQGFATTQGFREAPKHSSTVESGKPFTSFRNFVANSSQDFSVPPPVGLPPMTCSSLPTGLSLLIGAPPPASVFPLTSTSLQYQPQQQAIAQIAESVEMIICCKQCKETHRWPHVLRCLHVFCFPCLVTKFNPADQTIICPSCHLETSMKDGPCSLKMDVHASRMMLSQNISPFTCTACSRGQDAVTCCKTCIAYLCRSCQDGHQNINQFLNHTLVPITKMRKNADGVYTHFCDLHPSQQLTDYCCVCKNMICIVCRPDHNHPDNANCCMSMAEAFQTVAEVLRRYNHDSDVKADDMFGIAKKGPLSKRELDQMGRKVFKLIDDYCNYSRAVIEQNRELALKQVMATLLHLEQKSKTVASDAYKACEDMKTYKDFTSRTMNMSVPEDTLMYLQIMDEAYKRSVISCSKVTKENEHIQGEVTFTPDYKETHEILSHNLACIYHDNQLVPDANLLPYMEESHNPRNHIASVENSNHRYRSRSVTTETMPISTWNSVTDGERKNGTFISQLNRCRTKTSYIHTFGESGQGEYSFTEPSGHAYMKDGSYVICDTNNHRIVHYSASHEYIRTIGQPPSLPPVVGGPDGRSRGKFSRQNGYLYFPYRVAICPVTQNIVVTERSPSHDIQIFSHAGTFLRCFGGNILQHPRGVTVDEEGNIIVVECKIMKLDMFNQNGHLFAAYPLSKALQFPNDIAVKDKKIFISDNLGHCVHVFNYKAEFLYKIGSEYVTYFPIGVSINHLNQVVVTDNHNTFNITVFDMAGTVLHIFESVSKLAQCHNVSVHPTRLELMLSTKDCSTYFFSYDPEGTHALKPPASHKSGNAVIRTGRH
ncbi:unnamed protein product, partial [Candidula unifasciata]